jgi:putative NIF3 family GTP cyclohydrolase 1 type 2
VRLDTVVSELDSFFRVDLVSRDDWTTAFAHAYRDPAVWRERVEPGFERRWNGLMMRGGAEVERAATCVFPGDGLIESLEPHTLLFSEHPLDFADRTGFLPLAARSLDLLRKRACSLYVVHVPLYQHPELGPSRLLAAGLGLADFGLFCPLDPALPGGIVAIGESPLTVDGLADRARAFLGADIPVHVLTRTDGRAGTVAVVAGGGARADLLAAALARGCTTYVTGNAATTSQVERVQRRVRAFRELADAEHVALIDVTHYGSERPPQLAMVDWFERRGLPTRFVENGPR